jgi:hypothetical protein
MSIEASGTISLVWKPGQNMMTVKFSSVVMVLIMFFIAKISFETAMATKVPEHVSERSPASIDQSYNDHMNKR